MLNKPVGCVTSAKKENSNPTVYELLEKAGIEKIGCVGRLDQDSSGLLLFTTNSLLSTKIRSSQYKVIKKYKVIVRKTKAFTTEDFQKLTQPIETDALPVKFEIVREYKDLVLSNDNLTHLEPHAEINFFLIEGLHRQIRRICTRSRFKVLMLHRYAFGPLELGPLEPGKFRELETDEIIQLENLVV
jgi:23S rRNA pseudouridine2605 synthase